MKNASRFDVIVAGAGIAGIAAALECARSGMRVALVEKTILPGGLATSGLIWVYLPICDGNGRQVTSGLAEELLHLSLKYGPGDVPKGWRRARNASEPERFRTLFSPAAYMLALDEALEEAGVDIRLDTLVTGVVMKKGRITGIEVFDKGGPARLSAKCVIDATGDADVAHLAGAPCATGTNWISLWALMASKRPDAAMPPVDMVMLGGYPTPGRRPPNGRVYDGTSGEDVTRFVLDGRRLVREHLKAKGLSRREYFPVTLPSMAQYRTTRHIVGETVMTDGQDGRFVEDSIGMVPDWRRSGPVWEVPYRALVAKKVRGLLAAGRCISSHNDAWHVTRVIPVAALTGQACGAAATLAVKGGTTPDRLDPSDVQKRMKKRGVKLHLDELPEIGAP